MARGTYPRPRVVFVIPSETGGPPFRPSSVSAKFAVILEDHPARSGEIRLALARALPGVNVAIFATARECTRFLDRYLADAVFISLDYDLIWPMLGGADAAVSASPGTGQAVAEYLAGFPCTCPVIVHSANAAAARAMMRTLLDARWVCSAVIPTSENAWDGAEWLAAIELFRARGLLFW